MFATSYLKAYPGADDWVCIADCCCSYSSLLSHGYDCSAWWSPSRALVAFGNSWGDVLDMPATNEPDETAVCEWVRQHPGFLRRKIDAAIARREEREARSEALQDLYERYGSAEVVALFQLPDGSERTVAHTCGVHGPIAMLALATAWMRTNLPERSVLKKLEVFRKVPMHRGEKRLKKRKTTR